MILAMKQFQTMRNLHLLEKILKKNFVLKNPFIYWMTREEIFTWRNIIMNKLLALDNYE